MGMGNLPSRTVAQLHLSSMSATTSRRISLTLPGAFSRDASVAEEETGTEGLEHDANTVGADDPLFVPRLDLLLGARGLSDRGTEKDLYSWAVETICGAADDSQPVEQYAGNLGVSSAFVNSRQGAVAQVQWNNNLASIYTNPGNVSGVRWGSGTMISSDLFLTCGHLFDQTGGNWQRPRRNGTNTIISSQEIALNMHLNFNYQVDSYPRIF